MREETAIDNAAAIRAEIEGLRHMTVGQLKDKYREAFGERPRHASVLHSDNLPAEIERCEREIASVEHALLSGHPDMAGLCLALSDWSAGQRILKEQQRWEALRPFLTERACDRQPGRER